MRPLRRNEVGVPQPRPRALGLERLPDLPPHRFDPETDLTPADWQAMLAEVNRYRSQEAFWSEHALGHWSEFASRMKDFLILAPERKADLLVTESDWEAMLTLLNHFKSISDWVNVGRLGMSMTLLAPERRAELGIDATVWQGLLGALDQSRAESNWNGFAWTAGNMMVLDPERRDQLKITEADWQAMLTLFSPSDTEETGPAPWAVMSAVLFTPERKAELRVPEATWQQAQKELQQSRAAGNMRDFMMVASTMHLLAADEVRVSTRHGLELTHAPKTEADLSPLPARGEF